MQVFTGLCSKGTVFTQNSWQTINCCASWANSAWETIKRIKNTEINCTNSKNYSKFWEKCAVLHVCSKRELSHSSKGTSTTQLKRILQTVSLNISYLQWSTIYASSALLWIKREQFNIKTAQCQTNKLRASSNNTLVKLSTLCQFSACKMHRIW